MTTFNIALGNKVPGGITVELDMTNQAAISYLIEYGIKQSLNDAIAAVKITDDDYTVDNTKAKVLKRWDAIVTGKVRQAGTRETSDPIGVEAKRLATAWFKSIDDQKAKAAITATMKQFGIDDKTARSKIIEARIDHFRPEAEKIIESRKVAVAELADGLDDVLADLINSKEESE